MTGLSERYTDILEPHIPDDESLNAWFQREREDYIELTAVTDRRVLEMSETVGSDDREVTVDSTLLTGEYVRGVTYAREDETESPIGGIIFGLILMMISVILFFISLANGTFLGGLFGIVLLAVGAAIMYYSESKDDGEVTVEVKMANGTQEWSFPRGETDVPRAVSRVVAEQSAH